MKIAFPFLAWAAISTAHAQHTAHGDTAMPPMAETALFAGAGLERLENRLGSRQPDLRWQGQVWFGTSVDRIWLKTEGIREHNGRVEDGRHELLYTRAISAWADLQAGLRADLDSRTGRQWAALGAHGTAPMFVGYEVAAYFSDAGHAAARVALSYDLPLSEHLILQTDVETNIYSKGDPGRRIGPGIADIEAGLRLRYEFSRKFAPYFGVSYAEKLGETARLARRDGEKPGAARVLFGLSARF